VEVELGISLRHVVEELGGGLRAGARLRAVQVGGPLGGVIAADALDVELSQAALAAAGAALGHGGVVALDERVGAPELVSHLWSFAAAESCGGCSPCRVGSRRGLELAKRAGRGEDRGEHAALCDVMAEASLCAFGKAVPAAVRSALRAYGVAGAEV
jgi:bidirectional [NiFe] hydrogenase diaphorase subunit